jgi:hypothetical protein
VGSMPAAARARGGTGAIGNRLAALRAWLPRGEGLEREAWERRHRLLLAIVWLHVVLLPAYAAVQDRLGPGTALDIVCLAILALVANVQGLSRRVRACFASTALVTCSALAVHLSGGRVEAHFHFFVVIGLLVLYQDWVPYLLAVAYVAFEHGGIGAYAPKAVWRTASSAPRRPSTAAGWSSGSPTTVAGGPRGRADTAAG